MSQFNNDFSCWLVRIGSMKKLFLILSLSALVFSSAASAVEYVALNFNKPIVKLDPTDIVEIVGHSNTKHEGSIYFEGWGRIGFVQIFSSQFVAGVSTYWPV